jgi:hypothetical protein
LNVIENKTTNKNKCELMIVPCGTAYVQNGSVCSLRNCLCPKRKCLVLAELPMSEMEVLVPCGTAYVQNWIACTSRNCLCPKRKCLFLAELPMSKTEVLVPCGTAYVQNGSACSLRNCLCPVLKPFNFINSNVRSKIHKNIIFS